MPATIFSSASEVKSYGSNLSLNDVTKILSVSGNPASGAGTAAPVGSIALDYSNGKTYKKTGSLATEWAELGSGVGGINYIVNPDAESGTTGWSTYADAAGAQPVDGTGGSPSVTWTRSTTTPLRGTGDFNFVKDAVNRQGQGVSYDVTVDNADLARVLTVSFDYEVLSGTYATGDLTVYLIQDPTGTPVVIQPAGYQVVSATAGTKMTQIATFQTDATQKSYRLCFHVATTSASAYTLALDNIVLGPTQKVYGAPVTDWVSYTPTGTWIANTTYTGKYRRVGDSAEIDIALTLSGAPTSTGLSVNFLPPGLTLDTTKIALNGSFARFGVGNAKAGVTGYNIIPVWGGTSGVVLTYQSATTGAETQVTQALPVTWANVDNIQFTVKVPILGWSSNVEVSSSTDTRVVAARADRNGVNQTIATNNTSVQVQINSLASTYAFDSHGAFNTSTYNYIAPLPGYYRVTGTVNVQGTNVLSTQYTAIIRVDGTDALQSSYSYPTAGTPFNLVVSGVIKLNAGQTVGLWFYGLGNNSVNTLTLLGSISGTVFQIERLSGPSQIAASETVACRYTTSAGNAVANNTPTYVDFATKDYDTHGIVLGAGSGNVTTTGTGWRAIIPVSGKYLITAKALSALGGGWAALEEWSIGVYKNGIQMNSYASVSQATHSGFMPSCITGIIACVASDRIEIVLFQSSGASLNIINNALWNQVEIIRVGN